MKNINMVSEAIEQNKKDDFYDEIPMESIERRPMEMNESTFKLRNDPSEIIKKLKLSLLNAYISSKSVTDDMGNTKTEKKLKRIPGTKPLMSKQGVEECISYVERLMNNHNVQTYYIDKEDWSMDMLYISQDITQHLIEKREDWGLDFAQADILIGTLVNAIGIFLRRGIGNKEREGYTEGFKETTNRTNSLNERQPGVLSRFARKVFGGY